MRIQLIANESIGWEDGGSHGGAGISQRVVAEAVSKLGHTVELVVRSDREWCREVNGVTVRGWRPSAGRFGLLRNRRRHRQLAQEFARGQPAVTVIPDLWAVTWPYPLAGRKVVKFTSFHLLQKFEAGFGRLRLSTALAERLMLPRADAFMAISRRTAETTERLLGIPADSIAVIPNAVDTSIFCPDATTPKEDKLLLFVGTICEKKGAMETVGALDLLVKRDPGYKLIMIGRNGGGYDGCTDFTGAIRRRYPETCAKHVQFPGPVPNEKLPSFYRRASIAVLPSYYESFGRTTIEAMACGTAVVRSDAPPAKEIIEDGVSGMICRTGDCMDLARVVAELCGRPGRIADIGRAAADRAGREFSCGRVAAETVEFLERVVDS